MKVSLLHKVSGMSLMEVVVAIGVIAVSVPIILSATGGAIKARFSAEADTRSAWIAKEVQRQILANWDDEQNSEISTELNFPNFATESAPNVLLYGADGDFLEEGSADDLAAVSTTAGASYIVTFYGESHTPPNLSGSSGLLSLLHIKILHPAKSAPSLRRAYRYNLLTSEGGVL